MMIVVALVSPLYFFLLFYMLDPNRKPLKAFWKVTIWSLMALVPVFVLTCLKKVLHVEHWIPTDNIILQLFDDAFFAASIPEEVGKWLALWLFVKKCGKYFLTPYDGILFGACIGAVFAGLENIYYLSISSSVFIRLLFSLPGHVMHALIMGYFFALIHLGLPSWKNKVLMLLLPILFHGLWDFFLFLMINDVSGDRIIFSLTLGLFVVEVFYCVLLTIKTRQQSFSNELS